MKREAIELCDRFPIYQYVALTELVRLEMRCPYCGEMTHRSRIRRPTEDNTAIRRRRFCPECGERFTTFERVQLRELTVVKRSGRRVPFDRDKLTRSIQIALRKRPFDQEDIDRLGQHHRRASSKARAKAKSRRNSSANW